MTYRLNAAECQNLETSLSREWVLTNGIGGYAMGTASGINTRRYHGYLVAAVGPLTERYLLLAGIDAFINNVGVSSNQYPGAIYPEGVQYLQEFSVDSSARWIYETREGRLEKRLCMHPGLNGVTVEYLNEGEVPLTLTLRPGTTEMALELFLCVTVHGYISSRKIPTPGTFRSTAQQSPIVFANTRTLDSAGRISRASRRET